MGSNNGYTYRAKVIILNKTGVTQTLLGTECVPFYLYNDNTKSYVELDTYTIGIGEEVTTYVKSNDRAFMNWVHMSSGTHKVNKTYKIAVTCPMSSPNSATGYGTSGLQSYSKTGSPVTFRFHLGTKDKADWGAENSTELSRWTKDHNKGEAVKYGDCS